jgi:hypothetical protein
MRNLAAIVYFSVATLLLSCDQQHPASGIDPMLGLECFENQRASLPPGTQYEGIERLAENRLVIKIMNGVEVVTIDCLLNPDGTLRNPDK